MRNKVNAVEEWLDTSNLKGFQQNLINYYEDSLEEAADMVGSGEDFPTGPESYDSIGGRPAPLNPAQYPTWEEMDAIRHYYAPQILAEEGSTMKSIVYPALHEVQGVLSGDGWAQIKPDIYNNAIAVLDEIAGKDKMPATAFRDRLENYGGGWDMPKGEFGVFAKHALSRTIIPPKAKVDVDLIKAMNTIDIIATGTHE